MVHLGSHRLAAVALSIGLIASGCSINDDAATGAGSSGQIESLLADVERLTSENESLSIDLAAARELASSQDVQLEEADQLLAAADAVCLAKLEQCEEILFSSDRAEDGPSDEPAVWFPNLAGHVTNEAEVTIVAFADADADVTVAGFEATPFDWGPSGYRPFLVVVPLEEGSNSLDAVVDSEPFTITVIYDPSLVRRYGRVLDTRAMLLPAGSIEPGVEEGCGFAEDQACVVYELGIDFGEMDLEPDYGQGDFSPGEIDVEFLRLTPSVAVATADFGGPNDGLAGSEEVWNFFGHGNTTLFDVWNFLLDNDLIVQIAGPLPLGD